MKYKMLTYLKPNKNLSASTYPTYSLYTTKMKNCILTVLTIVLLWGRGESQDLPMNFRQCLRILQSNPHHLILRISGGKKTYPLDRDITS